ncbi:hypothetical protein FIBSPDRAFT_938248 [Athelia psychrophila]|uniref:BTB domain-containing protein n=1 Tax=Athelia psychrophila TaxID=1759441 RepID=A0A165YV77_9AGAM|nr:hypothetical protein FIBSPDRAFT_938248 [Fibularhizoctonia sp. CBS 109695]
MQSSQTDSKKLLARDNLYYWERPMITFAVEDTLFKVPQKEFEEKSGLFSDLFSLPARLVSTTEGSSDDNPIHLESIDPNDFRRLLMVLYPENCMNVTPQGHEEWISVLKLSTMWDFVDVRTRALREVSATLESKTPLDRIALAKEYKVPRWLLDAYIALVEQSEPLEKKEIDALGLETVYRLLQIREDTWRNSKGTKGKVLREFHGLEDRIVDNFYEQLKDAGYSGSRDEVPQQI